MDKELMKILAVLFLVRAEDHNKRKEFWGAVAYSNAYDWLCYAIEGRDDCLSMFDGYDIAEKFVKDNPDVAAWELEEIFDKREK